MSSVRILTVNCGSSSLRLDVFTVSGTAQRADGLRLSPVPPAQGGPATELLARNGLDSVDAVVHRVVHGGASLTAACVIDDSVETEIDRLAPLAPLHNPVALAWIRALRDALGGSVPQIAVFDTAYFSSLPEQASVYALPWQLAERHGIRRYGFHGLAHRAMWESWATTGAANSGGRAISLQLGAGCSVAATSAGKPLDTSMGFSPLEGLVMSTRCGDLDPGVAIYLLREGGFTPERLDSMLNDCSGLRGISGVSGDMEVLLESDAPRAARAVTVFCHRIRKYLGAYMAVLGGSDAILFGGGIGEHSPEIRARVLEGFEWAGIRLDEAANARAKDGRSGPIHAEVSTVEIHVVSVDEASMLATEGARVLSTPEGGADGIGGSFHKIPGGM